MADLDARLADLVREASSLRYGQSPWSVTESPQQLHERLVEVRARLDRLEEATMALEKSATSYQDKVPPVQRFFLAMAWHKRGDAAKARQLYDQGESSVTALTTLSPGDRGLLELVQAEAKAILGINQPKTRR